MQGDPATVAREIGERILDMIDDLPVEGEEFGESVGDKTRNILARVEERGRVTNGELTALVNMEDGISRWFHDR